MSHQIIAVLLPVLSFVRRLFVISLWSSAIVSSDVSLDVAGTNGSEKPWGTPAAVCSHLSGASYQHHGACLFSKRPIFDSDPDCGTGPPKKIARLERTCSSIAASHAEHPSAGLPSFSAGKDAACHRPRQTHARAKLVKLVVWNLQGKKGGFVPA
jgi:hypothetical protein